MVHGTFSICVKLLTLTQMSVPFILNLIFPHAHIFNFMQIFELITVTTTRVKNILILWHALFDKHIFFYSVLLRDLFHRYHLLKSTFILQHFLSLVPTAFTRRWACSKGKILMLGHQNNVNIQMALKHWTLAINPAFRHMFVFLIAAGVKKNGSAVNLNSYDSWAKIVLNGDRSWSH